MIGSMWLTSKTPWYCYLSTEFLETLSKGRSIVPWGVSLKSASPGSGCSRMLLLHTFHLSITLRMRISARDSHSISEKCFTYIRRQWATVLPYKRRKYWWIICPIQTRIPHTASSILNHQSCTLLLSFPFLFIIIIEKINSYQVQYNIVFYFCQQEIINIVIPISGNI